VDDKPLSEQTTEQVADSIANEPAAVAQALSSEVTLLREEVTILRRIDDFKAKVYTVAAIAAVFSVLSFGFLWRVSSRVKSGVEFIRTDLEVHRIRNEASHDCLAEKMAKLPPPELRGDMEKMKEFTQEFLGCVTQLAPKIVPPGAPDIRITTNDERKEGP
jgi:hypothetical protein